MLSDDASRLIPNLVANAIRPTEIGKKTGSSSVTLRPLQRSNRRSNLAAPNRL
jgi:hypothetical protein